MIVFIDTNILVDYLTKRELGYEISHTIFDMCTEQKIKGYISAHSILDTLYIMRKYPLDYRKSRILNVCKIVDIAGDNSKEILNALNNNEFTDIEDCVQAECALSVNADYIITRNIKDFSKSKVRPIFPEDFLKLF